MTRQVRVWSAIWALVAATSIADSRRAEAVAASCLMAPLRAEIVLPAGGFVTAEGHGIVALGDVPKDWQRAPLGANDLTLHLEGPEGSGRYWIVTVGVAARGRQPDRGVVIETSTAGFRSLQSFGNRGLQWLGDRDNDARHELVVWDTFFLNDKQVQSESGLVGWVYRVAAANDRLTLDWTLTRALAREVAAGYRAPIPDPSAGAALLRQERAGAAEALMSFVERRCDVPQEPRR
jgi:hypothetical protein